VAARPEASFLHFLQRQKRSPKSSIANLAPQSTHSRFLCLLLWFKRAHSVHFFRIVSYWCVASSLNFRQPILREHGIASGDDPVKALGRRECISSEAECWWSWAGGFGRVALGGLSWAGCRGRAVVGGLAIRPPTTNQSRIVSI
jgi:hypothetical protein